MLFEHKKIVFTGIRIFALLTTEEEHAGKAKSNNNSEQKYKNIKEEKNKQDYDTVYYI